jgi:hypothetical protein
MCVCVCVYIYIYIMCTQTGMYVHIHAHKHIQTYMHIHMQNLETPSALELVRCVATARIVMPKSMVRLSAGRNTLSFSEQVSMHACMHTCLCVPIGKAHGICPFLCLAHVYTHASVISCTWTILMEFCPNHGLLIVYSHLTSENVFTVLLYTH